MDTANHTDFVDHPNIIATRVSNGVANILGFHCKICLNGYFIIPNRPFTGESVTDLNKGIHSLYVY